MDTKWPKGERLKAAKCRDMFPLRLTSFDSSPAGGGAFWHCTQGLILYFKLSPFTGKVDTNEVSGRKGNNLQLFVFAINKKGTTYIVPFCVFIRLPYFVFSS